MEQRLDDEDYDRHAVTESGITQLRELAALAHDAAASTPRPVAPQPGADNRATAAAILRAVADLIESRPDIPEPRSRVSFYLYGQDAPATMAAIATALPCQWQASISRSGEHEWLNLDSNAPAANVTRGAQVHISAPAADACTASGAKTVTVWQPAPALAGLVGGLPLEEVA